MYQSKVLDVQAALEVLQDGQTVMLGGFANVGAPMEFIHAMVDVGLRDLDLIAVDAGNDPNGGIGRLILNHRARSLTAAHIGLNPEAGRQMTAGELKVSLIPMGTLAERIRCGGNGIGGFLTPTGVGTVVEEGKQVMELQGKKYLLELPLRAHIAVIRAWKADTMGNLVFQRCARNINPIMAMAADLVIAQAEEIVEVGTLDPEEVLTPGTCVNMVVKL